MREVELAAQNPQPGLAQKGSDQARSRSARLFNNLPLAAITLNVLGMIVTANRSASELFGRRPGQLLQHPLGQLLATDSRLPLASLLDRVCRTGRRQTLRARLSRSQTSGALVDLHFTLLDPDGRCSRDPRDDCIVCMLVDLTEHEQHLEQLSFQHRLADALLRLQRLGDEDVESFLQRGLDIAESLTDSALAFYCFVNEDHDCVWSGNALRHYGQAELPDLRGLAREGAWAESLRCHRVVTIDRDEAETGQVPATLLTQGLTRIIAVPVRDREVTCAILGVAEKPSSYSFRDTESIQLIADALWRVVSHHRARDALERDHRELAEARARAEDHAQAKSRFLAKMSHELRTPLNIILNLTQGAIELAGEERQRDYLRKTRRAARDLLALVNEILAFAKAESGGLRSNVERFDLRDLISDAASIFTGVAAGKALAAYCDTSPSLPRWLAGDRRYIKQVLINLLGNAVKFTEDGEVRLRIRATEADTQNARLLVSIQDSGPGLRREQIAQLFRPFSQLDDGITRPHGGIGLGLVLSRHLIELMGGKLRVNSQPGVGSNFYFTLALGRLDNTPLFGRQDLAPLHHERLLVVSAEGSLCHYLMEMLHGCEIHRVTRVDSLAAATAALHQSRADGAPLTLTLMDADLARTKDPEPLVALRAALSPPESVPSTRLVAIAPRFDAHCPTDLLRESDVWVEQPLTLGHLLRAMARHLDEVDLDASAESSAIDPIEALIVTRNEQTVRDAGGVLDALRIRVSSESQSAAVLERLRTQPPHLVLVDLDTEADGNLELVENIRDQPNCASLIVLGLVTKTTVAKGIDAGYIDATLTMPLDPKTARSCLRSWFNLAPGCVNCRAENVVGKQGQLTTAGSGGETGSDIAALGERLRQWRDLLDEDIPMARVHGRDLLSTCAHPGTAASLREIQHLLEEFELEQAQARIDRLLAAMMNSVDV